MPVIVITRLRLRDPAFFDDFFASAVAVVRGAPRHGRRSRADVLAEADDLLDPHRLAGTCLDGRHLRRRRTAPGHHESHGRLVDEAAFVDWERPGVCHRHAGASDGGTEQPHATGTQANIRDFPAPVVSVSGRDVSRAVPQGGARLSGEALGWAGREPARTGRLAHVAREILSVHDLGVQVLPVWGSSNYFRGRMAQGWGISRAEADDIMAPV